MSEGPYVLIAAVFGLLKPDEVPLYEILFPSQKLQIPTTIE